jgi:hypothetical protein
MTITIFGFDDEILDDYEMPSKKALNGFIPAIRRVARKHKGRPRYDEGCFTGLWRECLRDPEYASRDLYMLGYDFMLLGSRLLDMEKIRNGETLTTMLVVLKDGMPINPFQDYRALGALRAIDDYIGTADNVCLRNTRWMHNGNSGKLMLYAYTALYGGKDIDLDASDPWTFIVPGVFGHIAPALELNGHFPQLTNIGTVQRTMTAFSGRLGICIDCTYSYVVR